MKKNTNAILEALEREYGTEYVCYLNHENALQLLIATMLSAQCTDARVNMVTEDLFKKYITAEDFANADLKELEREIHSTGFYHNKAKNIIACCKQLVEKYNGEVPNDLEALTSLAGVGRKTANVVRGNIFHEPSVVVDTHVKRVSTRLNLCNENDTVTQIEKKLTTTFNSKYWAALHLQMVLFGRYTCKAIKPLCNTCPFNNKCNYTKHKN